MTVMTRPRKLKRKLTVVVITLAILVAIAWHVKNSVSLEVLIVQEQQVRQAIDLRPWRSSAIGLTVYALVSLVPGTSGKSIVFARLFGFWRGAAIVVAGLTAAALVMFYLSRYVLRDWIEHRYGKFLTVLNQHLQREGAFYLLTLRMAHFPITIVNLASGASRVHVRTFLWTTVLGLLPGTAIFVWAGIHLPSLEELATQGAGSLFTPNLVAALALSAVFPFVFPWCARRQGILTDTSTENSPEGV